MGAKVLSLALIAAIIALPVPASQLLAGTFSAPSPVVNVVAGHQNLRLLLQDPFLIDQMSLAYPASFIEVDAGAAFGQI